MISPDGAPSGEEVGRETTADDGEIYGDDWAGVWGLPAAGRDTVLLEVVAVFFEITLGGRPIVIGIAANFVGLHSGDFDLVADLVHDPEDNGSSWGETYNKHISGCLVFSMSTGISGRFSHPLFEIVRDRNQALIVFLLRKGEPLDANVIRQNGYRSTWAAWSI